MNSTALSLTVRYECGGDYVSWVIAVLSPASNLYHLHAICMAQEVCIVIGSVWDVVVTQFRRGYLVVASLCDADPQGR